MPRLARKVYHMCVRRVGACVARAMATMIPVLDLRLLETHKRQCAEVTRRAFQGSVCNLASTHLSLLAARAVVVR